MTEKRSSAITPRSLDVQAADVLREEILSGDLAPGDRLLEIELSERLNLSRGTIRSALQQLSHEGLVVQFPYRGCAVISLSAQDAWELYTLRSVLEGLAARLAAETITPTKTDRLKTALQKLTQAAETGSWKRVADTDFALHKVIIQLSEHQRLQQQYQIIEHQIRLYIASCNALEANLEDIVAQHVELVQTIGAGDAATAEQLAKVHNSDGQQLIDQLKASQSDFTLK